MAEAESASEASAGDAAKARREARKARILGAGTDRLARITKTGRGGEAELLYADKPKPLGGQSGSGSRDPLDGAPERDDDPLIERAAAAKLETDDPDDIDISQPSGSMMAQQQQQQQMPSFFGGNGQDMPQDLQGMIQAMQQAMGAGGRPGPGAPGAGPDMNFPFPPGVGLGMGAPPSEQPAAQTSGPHIVDRIFNLLRVFVFVGFGFALVYNAIKTGPALAEHVVPEGDTGIVEKFEHMSTLHRWARLGYERPAHWEARHFDPESFGLPIHGIPVFWLFITLEIALQSSRIMLQRSRPQPPGLLLKISAYLPHPQLRLLLRTLASYLPLVDSFVNDLAVVVFVIGCTIIFAGWRVGTLPFSGGTDLPAGLSIESMARQGVDAGAALGQNVAEGAAAGLSFQAAM